MATIAGEASSTWHLIDSFYFKCSFPISGSGYTKIGTCATSFFSLKVDVPFLCECNDMQLLFIFFMLYVYQCVSEPWWIFLH